MDNVFGFGIAIDFIGNYKREGENLKKMFGNINSSLGKFAKDTHSKLNDVLKDSSSFGDKFGKNMGNVFNSANGAATSFFDTLFSLKSLLVGGALGYGVMSFFNKIKSTGQELEGMYSTLMVTLRDAQKVRSTLDWAKKKAASTPFELMEVSQTVTSLTQMGKAKTAGDRERNFDAIGDFQVALGQSKGFRLQDSTDAIMKATFGNWERLGDNFGIRVGNLMGMAKNAAVPVRKEMIELTKVIQTAKAGTDEYSDAVIKWIGLFTKGGMKNGINTYAGQMSMLSDVVSGFFSNIAGFSQEEGSLFNGVVKSLKDIVSVFTRVKETSIYSKDGIRLIQTYKGELSAVALKHLEINGYVVKQLTLQDQVNQIGEKVGKALLVLWNGLAGGALNMANQLDNLIGRMDAWLNDFKGNVAPMIVFLTLLKYKIVDFGKAFSEGFVIPLKTVWAIAKPILAGIGWLINKFMGKDSSDKLNNIGTALGFVAGGLLAVKAIGIIASPFLFIWRHAKDLVSWFGTLANNPIAKSIFKIGGRAASAAGPNIAGATDAASSLSSLTRVSRIGAAREDDEFGDMATKEMWKARGEGRTADADAWQKKIMEHQKKKGRFSVNNPITGTRWGGTGDGIGLNKVPVTGKPRKEKEWEASASSMHVENMHVTVDTKNGSLDKQKLIDETEKEKQKRLARQGKK